MNLTVIMSVVIAVLLVTTAAAGKWAMHQTGVRAEAEASMRQWQETAKACSDSVEQAAKAGQEASRKAAAALKQARIGSAKGQAEIERLRASMGQKGTCEAAVQQVRKGLKP